MTAVLIVNMRYNNVASDIYFPSAYETYRDVSRDSTIALARTAPLV